MAPKKAGIKCKNKIPLVSNKYQRCITLDKNVNQRVEIIPPNAPINKGGQHTENKSALAAIIIPPAKVAFHTCSIDNFPFFKIIDNIKAQNTEEDNAQNVFPIAKYLEFKYW